MSATPLSWGIVAQKKEIVNTPHAENVEQPAESTPALTDKCTIIPTKHTVTGADIWVITLSDRLSADEYKDLSAKVKAVGGYYSRFAKDPNGKAIPGFIFNSKPDDNVIELFNNFFGYKS